MKKVHVRVTQQPHILGTLSPPRHSFSPIANRKEDHFLLLAKMKIRIFGGTCSHHKFFHHFVICIEDEATRLILSCKQNLYPLWIKNTHFFSKCRKSSFSDGDVLKGIDLITLLYVSCEFLKPFRLRHVAHSEYDVALLT